MPGRYKASLSIRSKPAKWSMWRWVTRTWLTRSTSCAESGVRSPASNSRARRPKRKSTNRTGSPKGSLTSRVWTNWLMRTRSGQNSQFEAAVSERPPYSSVHSEEIEYGQADHRRPARRQNHRADAELPARRACNGRRSLRRRSSGLRPTRRRRNCLPRQHLGFGGRLRYRLRQLRRADGLEDGRFGCGVHARPRRKHCREHFVRGRPAQHLSFSRTPAAGEGFASWLGHPVCAGAEARSREPARNRGLRESLRGRV